MSILNLDFNISSFINPHPITLKFKDCTKIITFTNKPHQIELSSNKKDIFATTVKFKPKIKTSGDKTEIDMCLYVNSPIPLFLQFLGSILQISTIDLFIRLPKNLHLSQDKANVEFPFNIYSSYLCIGDKPLIFESKSNILPNFGDYSEDYLKWYSSINNHIYDIISRTKNSKSEHPLKSISFTHNISNIEMICYCNKNIYVDILELFNYHSSLYKFKRIVIHDIKLDEYYNNTKVQYIKNSKDYGVSTKHVEGKQNTLTMDYLVSISEEISLNTIDIFHDGTFKLNFNISCNMSEKDMMDIITEYINKNVGTLFEDLLIKHCAYPIDNIDDNDVKHPLSIKDYTIQSSKFYAVYLIPDINPKNIKKINTLLTLEGAESRFASNTSLSLIAHPFINEHIIYNLYTNYKSYKVLNENMTKINIIPEIHFTFSGSNLTIFCNKFYSIAELKFELSFILPLIDYMNISENVDENLSPTDIILKRLRSIPVKQNLKQLIAIDPELFGPRKVSKNYRAYSALCQNKEQRPSIITDKEYDILSQTMKESVIRLRNQTFPEQYLNVACPYEKFPVLNFHHFNNQKCIVRCTTKQTNPGQYQNCASELGADIISSSKLSHQSNNIIKYNDNLPISRYCFLPQELQEIFPDYICINFNSIDSKVDIKDYAKRIFKCMALVIRRNTENREYEILSDYDSIANVNYLLVIEPESNPHLKYLIVHMVTFKPLIINDYKQFNDFIKHSYKVSSRNIIIMNYLNYILKLKIDNTLSIFQFINEIIKKGYKLIIKDDVILGLVKNSNEIIYLTPKISYPYKQQGLFYTNEYMIKNIRVSGAKYPNINEFITSDLIKKIHKNDSENEIDFDFKFCLDSISNKITGIFWKFSSDNETLMLIEPVDIDELCKKLDIHKNILHKLIKIYDSSFYIELLFNESTIDKVKVRNKLGQESILKKIMIRMLKRFIEVSDLDFSEIQDEDKLKKKFIDFCKDFGLLVKDDTKLVKKTSLMYDLYNTKINISEFEKWLNDTKITFDENLDNILYDDVIYNLKMNCDEEEIIIAKQFI